VSGQFRMDFPVWDDSTVAPMSWESERHSPGILESPNLRLVSLFTRLDEHRPQHGNLVGAETNIRIAYNIKQV
jgi:hypothetical protein